jgi:ubiquinone/menaquinone biosynthesis C-methylase UbiE
MPNESIVDQFTAQVERFVRSPHVNVEEPVARFVAAVDPKTTEDALDVACGPGLLAKAFAPRLRSFTGVDLTPAMVERAGKTVKEAGIANATFRSGDALALPFESGRFDVVLTRLAIHHIPDAAGALRESARVLKTGGRLGLFDMTTSEDEAEAAYHNDVERLRDPSHATALPLSKLFELIGKAGLEADRLETIDYELDVEDWISRAEQTKEQAAKAREMIAAALGTRRFGGKRVRQDEGGKLWFTVRWAIVTATRRP